MEYTSRPGGERGTARGIDLSWDNPEFEASARPKRDAKKLFLVIGLGALSWVATYVGMLELIEANMGELPLAHKAIVGFSVAMLMVMVVWLLDQMFSDIGWFTRLIYTAGYIFLTVISVGFGFGFYWKVLESRGESSRSAESAVGQVQNALHAAITRLEQLQGTLDSLTAISSQKAETERNSGLSCPNSRPGDGPRRKMRDDDAARFKFASEFVKGRIGTVKADVAALEADLVRIAKDDKSIIDARSGTRNEFMRNLGRKLDMTVTGFNAFRTDPQLKQIRIDLNERADKVTFTDTKGGTYTCPDTQLSGALKGVVRAIDELPSLEKPRIATVEGSEAVIEAFRRLTATFYGALAFKLPPSPEELRELQKKAVQSVENAPAAQARINALADQAGLSKRDYVPLAIAIFVDLCLLFVSMGRRGNRLQGLVPKMREAERGPVIQILSRFNEIHRDAEIRENFEMFRHVVFDFHGDYYAAIPLNAPYRPNPMNGRQRQGYGVSDAHELLQEAHLLANLFASFEKERIFTRVHSPLLSTKTVQKRLRRQGSKFANAEAFRLYRFKDGAWSEIILGAVMGAARRVEAEKRRRRVEEDLFRSDEPTLDATERRARTRESIAAREADAAEAALRHAPADPYPTAGHVYTSRPVNGHPHPGFVLNGAAGMPPFPAPNGSYGGAGWTAAHGPRPAAAAAAASAPTPQIPIPVGVRGTVPSGWAHSNAATAGVAATDAPPDRVPARAANNNTSPSSRLAGPLPERFMGEPEAMAENAVLHPAVSRPSAPVAPEPSAEPRGGAAREPHRTVTVEAVRETLTYRLPVGDAAVPPPLLEAAGTALEIEAESDAVAGSKALEAPAVEAKAPAAASVPPPLPEAIALPRAAADHGERAEHSSPECAHPVGWRPPHEAAHNGHAAEADDTRTMALRLSPRRDA
jgi:hypothetical protein